ncbi:signal peptidase I [Falsibacillus pallidus]|uniref:Signal peptidase I n=1 Tax=Falsibacillus pallidus TaxID=493781 RepID=A0A370GR12_9BACI|nr:signal peptidase I [Falsibacillus pallidus]RDI45760.1 signal peptidase I [Falsibacillus pallidus]
MKESSKSELMSWIKTIGITVIVVILVRSFLFSNYVVEGKSMMPTLQDGNRLIVGKLDYDLKKPDRFDIIVFHATETADYVKRVIGLPGDKVAYKNDTLYINGKPMKEPYLKQYKARVTQGNLTPDFTLEEITGETTVPKGKLFVLGDNRQVSEDSRVFGFVDQDKVVGKVDLRIFPFNEMQIFTDKESGASSAAE